MSSLDINPDRPLLVGPETPTAPFPFALQGTVVKGYGRGSKQLGIPTGRIHTKRKRSGSQILMPCHVANLSDEAIDALVSGLETGVYYGWTQIGELGSEVYPMVMSLGWNPYFKNEKRSAVSCVCIYPMRIQWYLIASCCRKYTLSMSFQRISTIHLSVY